MKPTVIPRQYLCNSCNTEHLIIERGYPFESHRVTTSDGYILELHRVPPHDHTINIAKSRYPVLLQHGLWSSSADWMIPDVNFSLGYQLCNCGFDVWLGNSRGNTYSRNHIKLSAEKQPDQFWNFSFHEMGIYDLPAAIDFILSTTGHKKLYYVGHSQGTTIFFVLTASKPEYNEKIGAMVGLAPVAYLANMKSPSLRKLASIADSIMTLTNYTGCYKLLPESWIIRALSQLSVKRLDIFDKLASVLFINFGKYACDNVKKKSLTIALSHYLTGASLKHLSHYAQLYKHGKHFRQYDYGSKRNIELYGTSEPPEYDLNKITCPVKLFYSDHDWLVHPQDVEHTYNMFSNKKGLHKVEISHFNHLDFIWSFVAKELIFDHVIDFFKNTKE